MSMIEAVPDKSVPREIFLWMDWYARQNTVSIKRSVDINTMLSLRSEGSPLTQLGPWRIKSSETEARLYCCEYIGAEEGLIVAGSLICEQLVERGFTAHVVNADPTQIPRIEPVHTWKPPK